MNLIINLDKDDTLILPQGTGATLASFGIGESKLFGPRAAESIVLSLFLDDAWYSTAVNEHELSLFNLEEYKEFQKDPEVCFFQRSQHLVRRVSQSLTVVPSPLPPDQVGPLIRLCCRRRFSRIICEACRNDTRRYRGRSFDSLESRAHGWHEDDRPCRLGDNEDGYLAESCCA